VFRGDYANLPLRRFPGYLRRSNGDIFSAWEDFKEARAWVHTNRYRFRCDARTMTNSWEEFFGSAEEGGES
jgi:hypothetical protein